MRECARCGSTLSAVTGACIMGTHCNPRNKVNAGDEITMGGRTLRVQGMPGAPAGEACRDSRGRYGVRNIVTGRLSYLPHWYFVKARRVPR